MDNNVNKLAGFGEVKDRSLQVRARSLRTRLDSVTVLCQFAEDGIRYATPEMSSEALDKARRALDRIRQQFGDRRHLPLDEAAEIEGRIVEAEAKVVRVGQRLRAARESSQSR